MIYLWIFIGIVSLYLVFTWLVYKFQKKLIFFPTILKEEFQFSFNSDFEEIWLKSPGRYRLNALHFKTKQKAKGCVLYHHGNSKDLQHWAKFHENFTSRGYDVLFYDYRGFGKSTGVLQEETLYKDSRKFYSYLKEQYPEEKIIQYGRSLGTALATRLAQKNKSCPLLILETPYYSMKEMARMKMPLLPINLILSFQLRQDLDIKKVNCPITIFTGTDDELTPHRHSLKLKVLNKKVKLVIIENGTHNGLPEFDLYQKKLDQLLT